MSIDRLTHCFVESIPQEIAPGELYISVEFATAIHLCCCGCGGEVVTPLSPTDWKMTFDGESISLHPSIGNWSLPCRSHYWIRRNRIDWASQWSDEEIAAGRREDRRLKAEGKTLRNTGEVYETVEKQETDFSLIRKISLLSRIVSWLRKLVSWK